ncbi:hypothetical protein LZ30DRAFT_480226 [Colletotrichum cereale]|nr:hypothetical protein LZ30DRAFT_480226 [Colletotrichum cereale]
MSRRRGCGCRRRVGITRRRGRAGNAKRTAGTGDPIIRGMRRWHGEDPKWDGKRLLGKQREVERPAGQESESFDTCSGGTGVDSKDGRGSPGAGLLSLGPAKVPIGYGGIPVFNFPRATSPDVGDNLRHSPPVPLSRRPPMPCMPLIASPSLSMRCTPPLTNRTRRVCDDSPCQRRKRHKHTAYRNNVLCTEPTATK